MIVKDNGDVQGKMKSVLPPLQSGELCSFGISKREDNQARKPEKLKIGEGFRSMQCFVEAV